MILRKCRACGLEARESKDLELFMKSSQSKFGRSNECSVCGNERSRRERKASPEKRIASDKRNSHTFKGVLTKIYCHQGHSSKKRGHTPPEYTKQELGIWLKSQPNFKKLFQEWEESGFESYKKPSVDRLRNDIGYSFDNIRLVTWKDNEDASHVTLKKIVLQFNKDGILVATHTSLNEAGASIGSSAEAVGRVCRGQYGRNTHKGYIWKYKE